jgi:hypothetical protein
MPDSYLDWFIAYVLIGVITFPLLRLLVYVCHRKEAPSEWVKEVLAALEKDKPLKERVLKVLSWVGTAVVVVLVWPLTSCLVCHMLIFNKKATNQLIPDEPRFTCNKDELVALVTPEEVEVTSYVSDPLGRSPNVPFGHLHQGWINFLSQLEPNDELWSFKTKGWTSDDPRSPKYAWPTYVTSGYAIVRNKKIVADFASEG